MTKKYNAWSEAMAGALNKNLLKYVKIWNLKPVLIFDHFNIYSFSKIYVTMLFWNLSNFSINIKVCFRAMIHFLVSEIIIWDFSLQVVAWYLIHIHLTNYLFSQCLFLIFLLWLYGTWKGIWVCLSVLSVVKKILIPLWKVVLALSKILSDASQYGGCLS